eukprot:TRINITY_DN2626_c0_g1_i6.p3 TRINITY_DN2626_c0_g1~~TRINITY_DN2626_c0_g1_i6.p3  ORF type:complete len:152 (+),score=22.62 TRINITY_DN2626_c0_g1_i6:286-741(+)
MKEPEADADAPEPEPITFPESPETSIIITEEDTKELPKDCEEDVDSLWNKTAECRLEQLAKPDLRRLMANPFLQQILHPVAVPQLEASVGPAYFLLHCMLLGNYRVHSKVVSDYRLKQELHSHEPLASSKYSSCYKALGVRGCRVWLHVEG